VSANDKYYADLRWAPEDIQTLRPDWSLERCEEWLIANQKYIRDRLCELGWDVIEMMIHTDDMGITHEPREPD
jgi:hypothetical protein